MSERRPSRMELWLQFVVAAGILLVLLSIVRGDRACHARGGEYVRGVIWFTCIGQHTP